MRFIVALPLLLLLLRPTIIDSTDTPVWTSHRTRVVELTSHAWAGYATHAWAADELKPESNSSRHWLHLATTAVSAIDTLHLMNLTQERDAALAFVRSEEFAALARGEHDGSSLSVHVSLFETTIRVVGGLLGAYTLLEEPILLERAETIATRLLPAFIDPEDSTRNLSIPWRAVELSTGKLRDDIITVAELGTLQLEFMALSRLTGNRVYEEHAMRVLDYVLSFGFADGLVPNWWNATTSLKDREEISFGSGGDSFYEYLLKLHLYAFAGEETSPYLQAFEQAYQDGLPKLLARSQPSDLLYIRRIDDSGSFSHEFQHLACFAGGMSALYNMRVANSSNTTIAHGIGKTCHELYNRSATGLGPEGVAFNPDSTTTADEYHVQFKQWYMRPEAIETWTYLYWQTRDEKYREWGASMLDAIEEYCVTDSGVAGLSDVTRPHPGKDDLQQAFFFSETLKYLFLLFSDPDDLPFSLDTHVLTTEAHLLKILPSRPPDDEDEDEDTRDGDEDVADGAGASLLLEAVGLMGTVLVVVLVRSWYAYRKRRREATESTEMEVRSSNEPSGSDDAEDDLEAESLL